MFNFCWFPTAILESFRFEDENDYKDDIWFYVFSPVLENRHPGKLHCIFSSPAKLARLFPLKVVKPSPDR